MSEIEILAKYEQAHQMCRKMGLELVINGECFEILRDGQSLFTKMKLSGIVDFLIGYELASNN